MAFVLIGKEVFKVDEGYLDEPADNIYPLKDIETDEVVGSMMASKLQKAGVAIPGCYIDIFKDSISKAIDVTYKGINILTILRLKVHSPNYINYVVGPMVSSELIGREGGLYFAFQTNSVGEDILYAGNTGVELRQNIRHDIRACNANVLVIHDKYFEEAIAKLLEMHKQDDICQAQYHYATFKDPTSTVAEPGEEENCHDMHCQWCAEMGLDGKHGNYWNSDGNVYTDPNCKTTHSHYGRVNNCK